MIDASSALLDSADAGGTNGGVEAEGPKTLLTEAPPTPPPDPAVAVGASLVLLLMTISHELPEVGGCRCGCVAMVVAVANHVGVATVVIVGVVRNNSSADDLDAICGCCMEVNGSWELTCMLVGVTPGTAALALSAAWGEKLDAAVPAE
eukprot:CAMPEP_0201984774 /NCGR_PEP_ID=MMETSP0904-20121228/84632_1 /ASSEMBLY_ACC=CAM_ASM_000553 /TAXON_ID=420261 /ORGANISM="Thalassiosira antarctica, Strain CCMP982" /LENGTH=148 /DNA_ID=CAMNT_0048538243 /DNA_START=152 /DNA_END=600 /DNA_ORIENTATION=+